MKNRERTSIRLDNNIKSPLVKKVRKSILSLLKSENKEIKLHIGLNIFNYYHNSINR